MSFPELQGWTTLIERVKDTLGEGKLEVVKGEPR